MLSIPQSIAVGLLTSFVDGVGILNGTAVGTLVRKSRGVNYENLFALTFAPILWALLATAGWRLWKALQKSQPGSSEHRRR